MGGNKEPTHTLKLVVEFLFGPSVFGPHLKPVRICWSGSSIVFRGRHRSHLKLEPGLVTEYCSSQRTRLGVKLI